MIRKLNQSMSMPWGTFRNQPIRNRGQALLAAALMLPVICGMMGLAIDVGHFYHLKRRMQIAADAGAIAGAQQMKRESRSTQIKEAAQHDIAVNGFNGSHGEIIAVNHPPKTGSQAGDKGFVEVTIQQSAPTFFMRVLGINGAVVGVRAVGGLRGGKPFCVLATSPLGKDTLKISGGSNVNVACGVRVNSSDPYALELVGTGSCLTANAIGVYGGYGGACFSPVPEPGISPALDPLADRVPPDFAGCDYESYSVNSGMSVSLNPGVYCGGIKINTNSLVTLNPGIYILNGGGLDISAGAQVTGQGVSFYITEGIGWAYAPIRINGGSEVHLSASSIGEMEGILFFQDRNVAAFGEHAITGNSNSTFDGVLYFPTQAVKFAGRSGITGYTSIIAYTIDFAGNSTLTGYHPDFSNIPLSAALKNATLVE